MNTYNVLILDADQRSALAVTRSLGKVPEIRITTAESAQEALAGVSRYSHAYLQSPSSSQEPDAYLIWLQQLCLNDKFDLVIPVTEITSQLLLQHHSEFNNLPLPFADYDKVMQLADKHQLLIQAEAAGVPFPKYLHFDNASKVNPEQLSYPCILKPTLSRIFNGKNWLSTRVELLKSKSDWENILANSPWLAQYPFMVQEFIPGTGSGVFCLYNNGQAVQFFAHRRLREKPPSGGVSVLSESIEVNPKLQCYAEKLLDQVSWHGVAMVEFRIDPQGNPFLMEVNTRFWGSLQLAIDSGINFPLILAAEALGQPFHSHQSYRLGQRLRWVLGDLDSLYLTFKSSQSFSEKLLRLLEFLRPTNNCRHEINRLEDPAPGWLELKRYFKQFFRHR